MRYLERYARVHDLEIVYGVEVSAGADRRRRGRTRRSGAASRHRRRLTSRAVVVATGGDSAPLLPDWPGAGGWPGELLHAAAYRNPAPYRGKDVLVVGAGNSGAEIAVTWPRAAARVRLAVRTAPHIVRRSVAGWPAQATGILVRRLRVARRPAAAAAGAGDGAPTSRRTGCAGDHRAVRRIRRDGAPPVHDTGLVESGAAGAGRAGGGAGVLHR